MAALKLKPAEVAAKAVSAPVNTTVITEDLHKIPEDYAERIGRFLSLAEQAYGKDILTAEPETKLSILEELYKLGVDSEVSITDAIPKIRKMVRDFKMLGLKKGKAKDYVRGTKTAEEAYTERFTKVIDASLELRKKYIDENGMSKNQLYSYQRKLEMIESVLAMKEDLSIEQIKKALENFFKAYARSELRVPVDKEPTPAPELPQESPPETEKRELRSILENNPNDTEYFV